MKKRFGRTVAVILAVLLVFALPGKPALAASATFVLVNGATLNLATPYWANGAAAASAAAPASGGYIYFDAAAATLTLHDAQLNGLSPALGGGVILCGIYADGDLHVELAGANTMLYATADPATGFGLAAAGSLTIGGSGSLDIRLSSTAALSGFISFYNAGDFAMQSGTISIEIACGDTAYGINASGDILLAGGTLRIDTDAAESLGMYSLLGDIRITGGTVSTAGDSPGSYAVGLYGSSVSFEGGTGQFVSSGGFISSGIAFNGANLSYSGGVFYCIGKTTGIVYDDHSPGYSFSAPPGSVFVSENIDGSGLKPWTSDAEDGLLISLLTGADSEFLYVRFGTPAPQTGDEGNPWLWAGIAGVCLLLGAGILGWIRKRRANGDRRAK